MSRVSPTLPPEDESDIEQVPERQSVWSALRRSIYWRCLLLTCIIGICLGILTWCHLSQVTKVMVNLRHFPITQKRMTSPCEEGSFYNDVPLILVGIFYVFYQMDCYHCPIRTLMSTSCPASEVATLVSSMRTAVPNIWWKAVCYRYVRRSLQTERSSRSAHSYLQHQVVYVRVNTHTAGSCFLFTRCGVKDISKKLVRVSKFPYTKIRFSKVFAFLNAESAVEFEGQRSRFFLEHERRDDYMEMREGLDLINVTFSEEILARKDKEMPWYTHAAVYHIASLLLLSWPLRFIIEFNTSYVHYQVTKLFGVNYSPEHLEHTNVSRSSVSADSQDLELSIAGNCSVAPSYSEAVLMLTSSSIQAQENGERTPLTSDVPQPFSYTHSPSPSLFFRPAPLPLRRPDDPFEGRWCYWTGQEPPTYEEALELSEPLDDEGAASLRVELRRSRTERDFRRTASRWFFPRRSCHFSYEVPL